MKKVNVLMTGCGAPGGPGIIKCLKSDRRVNLYAGDCDSNASGRYLAPNFIQLPLASDPKFIAKIISICQSQKINIIFPLVTKELFKFSENLELLYSYGIKVIVSEYDGLEIANNKIALYRYLDKMGISVPEYRVAQNINEMSEGVYNLGYPSKPVVIKPGISNGSRGVRVLDSSMDRYQLLLNEKPTTLISTLREVEEVVGMNLLPPMLISEYLPGDELTIDSIVSGGDVKILLIRTREKMNGGISVAGKFIEDPQVEEYCTSILKTLNLSGPIGLQLKRSEDGVYKLLEINPRIQGTSVAALGLNINLPILAISELLGWGDSYPKERSGIGFARFYDECFFPTK